MTYAPHAFPPGSPYAPSPVGPTAKYAGILLLIFGILALLMGGCFSAVGMAFDSILSMPEIQNDANFQNALAEMEAAGADMKLVMILVGVAILVYAVPAIVISIILMRARSKPPVIVGLVLVSLAMIAFLLFIILGLVGGNVIGAGFWVVVAAMHGLILMWLILSLRVGSNPTMMPGPYTQPGYYAPPMQGYQYQPPKDRTGL